MKDYKVLAAEQALKISDMEKEVADLKNRMKGIHMILFGCGGPLNDNVDGYTKKQFGPFFRIADLVEE